MSNLENRAVASLEELVAALASAREELRKSEQLNRRVLKKVGKGNSLASAIIATEPSGSRQSFDEALEELTTLRHRTRSLIFALAVEEGYSIGEVGRMWGVSRQLASRYAREAAAGSE
jgi:DNA-directed RNA polymerase sigma subunit (sigma70/sigma32)